MKKNIIAVMGIVFLCSNAPSVKSQETGNYEFTLEEITVTAQKREENQQKVAAAMEVFSGDDLKELGRNDIGKIVSEMSNVIVNKASDGIRVSLRGVSDDELPYTGIQASAPTVSLNQDGVFSDRKENGRVLYDVERVEVLAGPQSTLYASNTPGGVINVITGQPKTEKYEASGTIEYGNYNLLRTEGMMNAPINDKIALRAAFSTSVHDGYLSNGGEDEDLKSSRLKMLFKPNDKLSFSIAGELQRSVGQGITGVTPFVDEGDLSDPWDTDEELDPAGRRQTIKKVYGNMDWDIGIGTLSVVPSYSRQKETTTQVETNMSGEEETRYRWSKAKEKGTEIRLASNADASFEWIVGFNYYRRNDESETTGDNITSYNYGYNNQETEAAYGNITYPLTDRFRATAGLRKSWDENETYSESYRSDPDTGEIEFEQDTILAKYDDPDFKLGVEYDFGENSMVYANWSTSYRSYGMAMKDAIVYDPEKLNAYTVGSKNRFFNNKFQLNASAYFYSYENYMPIWQNPEVWIDSDGDGIETRDETFRDPWGPVPSDFRSIGVDIQTNTIITKKDELNFSISWLKAYFPNLIIDYYYPQLEDLYLGDKEKTFSPHWTLSAAYSHNFTLWNGGILTSRFDGRFQTKYDIYFRDEASGVDLTEIKEQEAHYLANFSAIYAHPDGKWTLTGYVDNIANYAEKRNLQLTGDGSGTMMIGSPRTYGGILSVRY